MKSPVGVNHRDRLRRVVDLEHQESRRRVRPEVVPRVRVALHERRRDGPAVRRVAREHVVGGVRHVLVVGLRSVLKVLHRDAVVEVRRVESLEVAAPCVIADQLERSGLPPARHRVDVRPLALAVALLRHVVLHLESLVGALALPETHEPVGAAALVGGDDAGRVRDGREMLRVLVRAGHVRVFKPEAGARVVDILVVRRIEDDVEPVLEIADGIGDVYRARRGKEGRRVRERGARSIRVERNRVPRVLHLLVKIAPAVVHVCSRDERRHIGVGVAWVR